MNDLWVREGMIRKSRGIDLNCTPVVGQITNRATKVENRRKDSHSSLQLL